MKAKELMIGDWVNATCFNGKRVLPQEKLQINSIDNVDKGFLIVEPIPLTPEILEANGFDYDEIFECYKNEEEHVLIYVPDYKQDVWQINICYSKSDNSKVCLDKYNVQVHELQHALRLCGLNEMAENFKLK